MLLFALVSLHSAIAAETLEQLIAGAKKESEITFIAGAQTFGGQKTLNLLEAAFNKRFGLNMKIRFSAGPEMNAMAARVITELKNGAKASSDLYHGSQSHSLLLKKSAGAGELFGDLSMISKDGNFSRMYIRCAGFTTQIDPHTKPKSYEDWWTRRADLAGSWRYRPMSPGCRAVDDLERRQG
jgi:hypothetical protein